MSGLEVGVAVMGIVAAFTTAADFFSRLRGKRKAKKAAKAKARQEQEEAAKEESVDKSLVLGRREVRREYDTDLARLGPEFQRGDGTGVRQVQNMLIDLQNNVISVLTNLLTSSGSGLEDAVNKSVVGLLKSSDRTRKGTVRALKDQYQRMSIKKPLKAGPKAKNTVLCRFYNTSRGCRYGDQCWYAHVDADSDSESGPDDTPSSEYPTTTTPSYRFTSYPGDHSSDDFCPFAIDLQKDSSIPIPEPNTREDGTTSKLRFCPALGCRFSWDDDDFSDFKPRFKVSPRFYFKQHLYSSDPGTSGGLRCRWCVSRWDSSVTTRLFSSCPETYTEVKRFKEHIWDHDHGIYDREMEFERIR